MEAPELAAPRELDEETGYRAESWRPLGRFWTAPGFTDELMHLYLATDLLPLEGYRDQTTTSSSSSACPGGRPWPWPRTARSSTPRRWWACCDWPGWRMPESWAASREPLPQVDARQSRAGCHAGDATALGDGLTVDLLEIAGEVHGGGTADVAADGEEVDRRTGVLEVADPVGRQAARNDDLDVFEAVLIETGPHLADEVEP